MLRGSSARTGQYYNKSGYRVPTGSRAYAARSQLRRSRYERQQDIPLDDWDKLQDEAYTAQVISTRLTKRSADRGSEDGILPPNKGIQIMKTTEVTVE